MSKQKFNVGDKVKILDTGNALALWYPIKETVVNVGFVKEYDKVNQKYVVKTEDAIWRCRPDNLELVKTEETNMNTNEQNYTKDYSLLRKFDLEAAMNGEHVMVGYGNKFDDCVYITHHIEPVKEYVFDVKDQGFIVVGASCTTTRAFTLDCVKMKPLAWVEGKPVYKGDVLYATGGCHKGTLVTANGKKVFDGHNGDKYLPVKYGASDCANAAINDLTWNKPKVKREGWLNIYKNGTTYLHDTEEEAVKGSVNYYGKVALNFVTTIRIEWEE